VPAELRTERLRLRAWRESDLDAFARLNGDPEVMRYFPAPMTRSESDGFARRIMASMDEQGWGLWAVELPGEAPFLGFVGLTWQTFEAPFTPAVEVGWRLDRPFWGRGYASEAARAAVQHGFEVVGLDEIISMTTVANEPSRAVMRRLGMTHDEAEDFEHPRVPVGHPIRPHVLYRLSRERWMAARTSASSTSTP
jgi:RimJ/RimL family protein N-acetyltransferase